MKRLPLLAVPLSILYAGLDLAHADIGILVEYIELDEPTATKLVREHGAEADATTLRELIGAKVAAGDARIAASSYIRTQSGQRAKVESIHEFIYPTEYDPPEIPQTLTGPIDPAVNLMTNLNATAFEMRPVGETIEVDPVVDPETGIVSINIAPQRVEFIELTKYGKDHSESVQPLFYTTKSTTAVRVNSGGTILLAVHTPRADGEGPSGSDPGRRVLAFLKADVLWVEAAAAAKPKVKASTEASAEKED